MTSLILATVIGLIELAGMATFTRRHRANGLICIPSLYRDLSHPTNSLPRNPTERSATI